MKSISSNYLNGIMLFMLALPCASNAGPPTSSESTTGLPASGPIMKCHKLTADRIDVKLLSKTSNHTGRVRLTGVVKNIGEGPWVGGVVIMYLKAPKITYGGQFDTLKERISGPVIPVGGEATIEYELDWNIKKSDPTYYVLHFTPKAPKKPGCPIGNTEVQINRDKINSIFFTGAVSAVNKPKISLVTHKLLGAGKIQSTVRYSGYLKGGKYLKVSVLPRFTGTIIEKPLTSEGIYTAVNKLDCNQAAGKNEQVTLHYQLMKINNVGGGPFGLPRYDFKKRYNYKLACLNQGTQTQQQPISGAPTSDSIKPGKPVIPIRPPQRPVRRK